MSENSKHSLLTSTISTRSRVALVTLITLSVAGTFYYRRNKQQQQLKKNGEEEEEGQKTKREILTATDDNSLYNDFIASLPEAITLDRSTDDFLSNLFSGSPSDYLPDFIPTSFEELKAAMASFYPTFENQIETIKDMYNSFWDFLSLEEFKNIVRESLEEDDDPELHPEIHEEAYVREGQELSEEEVEFAKKRKARMRAAFAFFIGVDEHEVEEEDIPNIGVASSGGGYRAMVACSGYLNAMQETGIFDCVLYMAGVSGSTWAMSQFYSPLTDASVSTLKDHLSSRIHTHIANLSNFLTVLNASRHNAKIILHGVIQRYYQQNGSVSLVDIFGMLLGGTLLSRIQTITAAPPENERDKEEEYRNKFEYSESIEENPDANQKGGETGTIHEDDGAEVKPRLLKKDEIKLSKQREYFEDGSLPMPIYCAVRHEIELASVTKAETISNKIAEGGEEGEKAQQESDQVEPDAPSETNEEQPAECTDLYQWFEFTPYDMGSEEINAWIPIWAFGRKFENGKSLEKIPEQSLGILMGMFGSAFVASLAHFYQEIRLLLPASAVQKADQMIQSYESSISTVHPISPASFPNPFYKMATTVQTKNEAQDKEEILRSESLVESEQIGLMDAGMDNNIPFYPLLRQGRDVDIIISLDLSADIQDTPFFDRAEGYVKRRGISGWPQGAGWPKREQVEEQISHDEQQKQEQESIPVVQEKGKKASSSKLSDDKNDDNTPRSKYALDTCTIFDSSSTEATPAKATQDDTSSVKTTYPPNTNPITIVYFPLIVNEKYDPEFDPQNAEFCSTWNFVYTSEQVNKLHGLAEANMKDNLEKVRKVIKETWKRKRDERLKRQDLSDI